MLTPTDARARGLSDLPPVKSDSLLALIALAEADPRNDKIDVGVGVFRDAVGNTPILKVIKEAERRLVDTQATKAYLGSAGDKRFAELLRPILLGEHAGDERIAGLQTPGGCGALRLGFELIRTANPSTRVLVGTPTWPNHPPIIRSVNLELVEYPYYDRDGTAILFEEMIEALSRGAPGDVALLHGCCHNPTGADLNPVQWAEVTDVIPVEAVVHGLDSASTYHYRLCVEDAEDAEGSCGADRTFTTTAADEVTGQAFVSGPNVGILVDAQRLDQEHFTVSQLADPLLQPDLELLPRGLRAAEPLPAAVRHLDPHLCVSRRRSLCCGGDVTATLRQNCPSSSRREEQQQRFRDTARADRVAPMSLTCAGRS